MKGYLWGMASVLLVTLSQLLMKWGMMQFPLLPFTDALWQLLSAYKWAVLAVAVGLVGYLLSMLCWFFTLHYLPLNRAYPLLSISYVGVYLAAVFLPWLDEPVTWLKTTGILLILFGLWLINSKSSDKQ